MKKDTLKKVLKYASKYHFLIVVSMVLAVVTAILSLYVPILAGNAIDNLLGKEQVNFEGLKDTLLRIVITVIVIALCQWIMNRANNRITFQVVRDVRRDAFSHLQILPWVLQL